MLLQRKNEKREASSMSLTLCDAPTLRDAGIALLAVDEGRARQDARHRRADSGVEVAAVLARAGVERSSTVPCRPP